MVVGLTILIASEAFAQDWAVDWHSIDSGGVLESESGDQQWQLSGTIGQWDATPPQALDGPGWSLSGGFWSVLVDPSGGLFRDRFEVSSPKPRRSVSQE